MARQDDPFPCCPRGSWPHPDGAVESHQALAQSVISDLETGGNTNPSWDVLSRRLMDVATRCSRRTRS
jgi:hypothetical protein